MNDDINNKNKRKCSDKFLEAMKNPERCNKISESKKGKPCPQNQITNRDPEKIRKTAEKHRGMKRTTETCKNISESKKGTKQGSENSSFRGYWITPFGKFDSLKIASDTLDKPVITIRERCISKNNKTVKSVTVNLDPKLDKTMLGKTWAELGWGFEPVEKKNV